MFFLIAFSNELSAAWVLCSARASVRQCLLLLLQLLHIIGIIGMDGWRVWAVCGCMFCCAVIVWLYYRCGGVGGVVVVVVCGFVVLFECVVEVVVVHVRVCVSPCSFCYSCAAY